MRNWLWLLFTTLLPALWFVAHFAPGLLPFSLTPGTMVILTGLAIVGAAFFLSWSIELLEHDIPSSLSLIIVSLVSVLPEYAVDITFAWKAGQDPTYIPYAMANMTGANRILIGLGWAVVVLFAWIRTRRPRVEVDPGQSLEIAMLLIATIYSFIIPIKGSLSLFDTAVFGLMFIVYAVLASRGEKEEPELVGPPAEMEKLLSPNGRRFVAILMLAYGGFAIYTAAEPFAESLVHLGESWGIDKFLLVQWLAPLASESPEFLVALLFVFKGRPSTGLGALISSKVNQWTLLIGAIPLAYGLSKGQMDAVPLDLRQTEELLLTSAQSILAAMFLIRLRLTIGEGLILMFLFTAQFVTGMPAVAEPLSAALSSVVGGDSHELPAEQIHRYFSYLYIGLSLVFLMGRGQLLRFWKAITFRASNGG